MPTRLVMGRSTITFMTTVAMIVVVIGFDMVNIQNTHSFSLYVTFDVFMLGYSFGLKSL